LLQLSQACAIAPPDLVGKPAVWIAATQGSVFDQTTGVKIAQFQAEPSKADTSTISPLI
jgi:hypothetical protein